ncbi:MAG TPA: ankyrin repeat domain-containing protein [Candidatus Tectomicrobia bacterium]|nr:ankyrin repeat domain-containing protein [Candidatus Tectomicrobia bacterium]
MDIIWDGTTRSETLGPSRANARQELANSARVYDWPRVLAMLTEHPEFVNALRPGGRSLYAPLHQAAHGGASIDVVQRLLDLGAWRTLQNARGERPVDVARRMSRTHLGSVLQPEYKRHVPLGILLKIQSHFHAVIRERAARLIEEHALRLPELEPLLELERPTIWFPIPGMAGGFSYWLEEVDVEAKLITESWCRMVDGSGQRHEITSAGSLLVDEGFV